MGCIYLNNKHKIVYAIVFILLSIIISSCVADAILDNIQAQALGPATIIPVPGTPPPDTADMYIVKSQFLAELETVYRYSYAGAGLGSMSISGALPIQEEVLSTSGSSFFNRASTTHVAAANTKPITGVDYTNYWSINQSGTGRSAWVSGYKYLNINGGVNNISRGAVLLNGSFRLYIAPRRFVGAFSNTGAETSRYSSFGVQDNTYSGSDVVLAAGAAPENVGELRYDSAGLALVNLNIATTTQFIYLFNTSGSLQLSIGGATGSGDSQFSSSSITGLALTATEIIVSDRGNNPQIKIFNRTTGAFIRKFGANGAADGQLGALGSSGIDADNTYIYVNDTVNDRLTVFDHNGNFVAKVASLNNPTNIRITATRLYLYNSGTTGSNKRQIRQYDRSVNPPTFTSIFLDLDAENKTLKHMFLAPQ